MLKSSTNVLLTIKDESAWIQPSTLNFPEFHQHVELPPLRQLIALHLSCVL